MERVHSIAALASGLNQSISRAAGRGGVVVAANADRAALGQPFDDGVRLRAVPDDVAEMPDRVDRPRGGEHGVEGDEVAVDVGDDCDPHTDKSSSDPLTTAGASARPGRADTFQPRDHAP